MLNNFELDIVNILLEQKAVKKEEIIIRINLERQSKQEAGLGYRAFKLIIQNLEHKSFIECLTSNCYQLTTLGKQELDKPELFFATY